MNDKLDTLHRVTGATATATASGGRTVILSKEGFDLAEKADLYPPETGRYNPIELDAHLAQTKLDSSERFELKTHLRNAGLLLPGRPISQ